jgi:hypothetical protein
MNVTFLIQLPGRFIAWWSVYIRICRVFNWLQDHWEVNTYIEVYDVTFNFKKCNYITPQTVHVINTLMFSDR